MSSNQDTLSKSELKLGSITEVWKSPSEWSKFCQFLDKMEPEGLDSEGVPIKLSRYAVFLKLYVDLYHREQYLREEVAMENHERFNEELKKMVLHIKGHEEDFFGTERCLGCIDAGVRKQGTRPMSSLPLFTTLKKNDSSWLIFF